MFVICVQEWCTLRGAEQRGVCVGRGAITWGGAGAAVSEAGEQPPGSRLGCSGPCKPAQSEGAGRRPSGGGARGFAGVGGAVVRGLFPRLVLGCVHSPAWRAGPCSARPGGSGCVQLRGWGHGGASRRPSSHTRENGAAAKPLLSGLFCTPVCVCVCVPVLGLHTECRRQGGLSWAAPRPLAGSGFVSLSRALGRGAVPSAEASALSKPRSVYPGRKCTAGSWRAAYRRAGPTPGQAAACWCWTTCLSFFVLIKSGLLEQKNKRHKKT